MLFSCLKALSNEEDSFSQRRKMFRQGRVFQNGQLIYIVHRGFPPAGDLGLFLGHNGRCTWKKHGMRDDLQVCPWWKMLFISASVAGWFNEGTCNLSTEEN